MVRAGGKRRRAVEVEGGGALMDVQPGISTETQITPVHVSEQL